MGLCGVVRSFQKGAEVTQCTATLKCVYTVPDFYTNNYHETTVVWIGGRHRQGEGKREESKVEVPLITLPKLWRQTFNKVA